MDVHNGFLITRIDYSININIILNPQLKMMKMKSENQLDYILQNIRMNFQKEKNNSRKFRKTFPFIKNGEQNIQKQKNKFLLG